MAKPQRRAFTPLISIATNGGRYLCLAASQRAVTQRWLVDNTLYIFGGADEKYAKSYSVATFDPVAHTWSWPIHRKEYPAHVPVLGTAAEIVPVFGGKKILLLPGFPFDRKLPQKVDYSAARIVMFDTTCHSFEVYSSMSGDFPSNIAGCDILLSRKGFFDGNPSKVKQRAESNTRCAVMIAGWEDGDEDEREDTRDVPELWILNLCADQPSVCKAFSTGFRKELLALDASLISCAVIADKTIALFGSSDPVDEEKEIDTYVQVNI
ncbi:hypothetical protein H0H81_008384 [Sphagnurus paluster]|uniref:Uncharacterized protein n=1 Tax=Sphagnurus paluster TaxID=117069 RepID=A0A9P7FU62_9AGAR|nr:hypothetical protein H0H81_008384 [Sphagnurus paluster]